MSDAHLIDCDVWVSMSECGKYRVSETATDAVDNLRYDTGAVSIRTVKITVRMSPPDIDGATIRIPDEAGELQVAAE